ncbi:Response regulator receiver domain-containing protein [Limimonas halophila]|uniref:Response regulator receiver domain-containing protein n=1 Tax=Limimonas halophila TaxID=1082479 RepID=A0A1G7TVM7_9PROT|nr:response regulator [Limimonas halophila]SDG39322.1 Response regulator receiver domain-containing protein [Limimonas halophila]
MATPHDADTLAGLRVLLVEDEYLVARGLRRLLADAGATVFGPVGTFADARAALAAEAIDVVLLDIALRNEEESYALADELVAAGRPFAFVTGYDRSVLPERFAGTPWVGKPFSQHAIARAVRTAMGSGAVE